MVLSWVSYFYSGGARGLGDLGANCFAGAQVGDLAHSMLGVGRGEIWVPIPSRGGAG